ncbi:MAG: EamA family transporter [Myxococcales bacterium]|nr:EamA family transporter [Myxococcales bacterium]
MSSQATYLDEILAAKRAELETVRPENLGAAAIESALAGLGPCRDFWAALSEGHKPRAIAEFKRRSPSEGVLRENADPRHVASLYVAGGAAAISVLTDRHFDGSFEDLRTVRSAVSVPVLCKDFILTRGQILRARREGADAVLLIVAALDSGGMLLYAFAGSHSLGTGQLATVAVLASSFPLVTIALAHLRLRESLRSWQWFGVAAVIGGVAWLSAVFAR